MSKEVIELLIEIVNMLKPYNLRRKDILTLEDNVKRIVEIVRNYDDILERKL